MKYRLKEIKINETPLSALFGKHSKAGYIIITAFRGGDKDVNVLKQNYRNNSLLKSDIKSSGFSFTPVWGGFIEDNGKEVKEQSFIVFNFKKNIEQETSQELFELGRSFCKKYKQEAFLYKPKGEENKSFYIDSNGTIKMTFTSISPTSAADDYFTSLNKSRMKNAKLKAFTYKEGIIYLSKSPNSLYEAYMRYGEKFFNI